jgi:hypothetical protein
MFGDLTVAAVAMIGAEIVIAVCLAARFVNRPRHR